MSPKVVVITRTKDRTIFLKRALSSVASQTYSNYVHVIVNDGGDARVIDELVANLSEGQRTKTHVFHRENASGAPDTIFNESIDRIDSEYFAIHDDDDSWHSDFLKRTVDHLDANTDLGAVVVRTDKVVETLEDGRITKKKVSTWMSDLQVISLYRQCIDNQFTPISTLFRRSAYQQVGKFDDSLPVVGDWEFGLRLLKEFEADFLNTGYALASYHHRTASDNSFARHSHRYYSNKVMNQYLREELRAGQLGVGYIMSQLKYNQTVTHNRIKSILPKFATRFVKRHIND